jgi:DNA-binding beta-propeller fold protein YncE
MVGRGFSTRSLLLSALVFVASPSAGEAPTITQLPGAAGCFNPTGAESCAVTHSLDLPFEMTVSPDGRNAYVVVNGSDALLIFDLHESTGEITPKSGTDGCVSDEGSPGQCVDGNGIDGPAGVAVSHDGRNLYLVAFDGGSLAVFDRNEANGTVTQKGGAEGCFNAGASAGCGLAREIGNPVAAAVSRDGRSVYVLNGTGDGILVFDRDPTDGSLAQKHLLEGCINETGSNGCTDGVALDGANAIIESPDGQQVYVASRVSNAVEVFDRDPATGALTHNSCISEAGGAPCADGSALQGAVGIAVSPDGKSVYVASIFSNAVAVFTRDPTTGVLTHNLGGGCLSDTGTAGACTLVREMFAPASVAVSPDGESVYVGVQQDQGIAVFDRDFDTGVLTQKTGTGACVRPGGAGGCASGRALAFITSLAMSPDGESLYGTASISNSVFVFERESPPLDIDGDGETLALTDGLLAFRYAFGFRGAALIASAVDLDDCTRCTAEDIEAFLDALIP